MEKGAEIAVLPSHGPGASYATFSPDGTRLVRVSGDNNARILPVFSTTQALIDHAQSVVPRELTPCERKRFFLPVEGEVGDCPN